MIDKSTNSKVDNNILERYFKGECSVDEKVKVKEWFLDEKYFTSLRIAVSEKYNKVLNREDIEVDKDEMQSILDMIHGRLGLKLNKRASRFSFRKVFYMIGKVAAVLFIPLLLFSGWLFIKYVDTSNNVGIAELMAPRGARIHFTLPDGTQGWLNSESTITYPIALKGRERKVNLSGEAYFEVVKNPSRPFIVNASNYEVEVLGTKFSVNAYKDDDFVQVVLLSGKVKVNKQFDGNSKKAIAELMPGEKIRINKADASFKKKKAEDPYSLIYWKDGKLALRDAPLDEVIKKLGRWYNVDFYIQDKDLIDYRYHVTLNYESLDEVLKLLKLTSPLDYKIIKRQKLPDGTFSMKKIILFAKKDIKLN